MSKRKSLSPEAEAALNSVLLRACERMEQRKADRLAEEIGRLCDELGANV